MRTLVARCATANYLTAAAALGRTSMGMRLLMSAASKPQVTQDQSRGGLITVAPGEDVAHSATFVGPIHGLGDTNMGWLDVAGTAAGTETTWQPRKL